MAQARPRRSLPFSPFRAAFFAFPPLSFHPSILKIFFLLCVSCIEVLACVDRWPVVGQVQWTPPHCALNRNERGVRVCGTGGSEFSAPSDQ